jgi:hypothetical protein
MAGVPLKANPWLRIDYGQAVQIDKIVVANRMSCCQHRIVGATISVTNDTDGNDIVWSDTFAGERSVYQFGYNVTYSVKPTKYTDVATQTRFAEALFAKHVRINPLAWDGNELAMRAALVRGASLEPAVTNCTDIQGDIATAIEWFESSQGVDLAAGQNEGSSGISFEACKAKAMATTVKFFAWTGEIFGGYCKVPNVDCPDLTTNQGYGYKLWERDASVPTGNGYGPECDGLVTDGTCTHKCTAGYLDGNEGKGQNYTCYNNQFVGTPLLCRPELPCTEVHGSVAASAEWTLSTAGRDLKGGQNTAKSGTSLEACKALASATTVRYFAWSKEVNYCKILKPEFAANPNLGTYQGYGYQLWERDASVPTGEGFGAHCDGLVTDGECTHKCLDGYTDGSGEVGQNYTCHKNQFVGTPLTCTPMPCDASYNPKDGVGIVEHSHQEVYMGQCLTFVWVCWQVCFVVYDGQWHILRLQLPLYAIKSN